MRVAWLCVALTAACGSGAAKPAERAERAEPAEPPAGPAEVPAAPGLAWLHGHWVSADGGPTRVSNQGL